MKREKLRLRKGGMGSETGDMRSSQGAQTRQSSALPVSLFPVGSELKER